MLTNLWTTHQSKEKWFWLVTVQAQPKQTFALLLKEGNSPQQHWPQLFRQGLFPFRWHRFHFVVSCFCSHFSTNFFHCFYSRHLQFENRHFLLKSAKYFNRFAATKIKIYGLLENLTYRFCSKAIPFHLCKSFPSICNRQNVYRENLFHNNY